MNQHTLIVGALLLAALPLFSQVKKQTVKKPVAAAKAATPENAIAPADPALAAQAQPWHKHLSDPRFHGGYLLWFSLNETPAQVEEKMGQAQNVMDHGPYRTLQYMINVLDRHDYSHSLVFLRETGELVSVTRNYEFAEFVDALFPEKLTDRFWWPNKEKPQYGARARRLSGDRLLLAFGSLEKGQPTTQLMLIKRSALQAFAPWILPQLEELEKQASTNQP
jgi:hypothetical protein